MNSQGSSNNSREGSSRIKQAIKMIMQWENPYIIREYSKNLKLPNNHLLNSNSKEIKDKVALCHFQVKE